MCAKRCWRSGPDPLTPSPLAACTMNAHAPSAAFSHANSAAAGGLGLPLAFVALPLYVHLPHWYATH